MGQSMAEIHGYIRECLRQGIQMEAIKTALRNTGWQTQDIDEAFAALSRESTKPSKQTNKRPYFIVGMVTLLLVVAGIGAAVYKTRLDAQKDVPLTAVSPSPATEQGDSPEKELALKQVNFFKSVFECQYNLDKRYPKDWGEVTQVCELTPDFTVPEQYSDLNDFNYRATADGQDYYFEVPSITGEGYVVTAKETKYVIIPKDTQDKMLARSRDSQRLSDFSNMRTALYSLEAESPLGQPLCANAATSCVGRSNTTGSNATDGTGWIKKSVNTKTSTYQTLPIDPVNSQEYHYLFCADKTGWLIAARLETSELSRGETVASQPAIIEGTNETLLSTNPECTY